MIKSLRKVIVIVLLSFVHILSHGQIWLDNASVFNEAKAYLEGEEYEEAIPLFLLLEKKGLSNANISYNLGKCYLNIEGKKSKAIPCLEGSLENISRNYTGEFTDNTAPIDAYLSLGFAYRIGNRLDKAIASIEIYKDSVRGTDQEQLADYYIRQIENAKLFTNNPVGSQLELIEDNSSYSISNPVVISDSALFYMEDRPFYEAIVSGAIKDNILIERENITPIIGTDAELSLVSVSPDGKFLFFTAYIAGNGSELFYSQLGEVNNWGKYQAFPFPINSPSNEPFASITSAGDELFFCSNRPNGIGANDIYVSRKGTDNVWEEPINLGTEINTPFNESACYISGDGKKLYFSSEGHLNMGGYDLFVSLLDSSGKWGTPLNLGSPISTTDDDDFISVSTDGKLFTSRYSSVSGKEDIYRIIMDKESLNRKIVVSSSLAFSTDIPPKSVTYIVSSAENDKILFRSTTTSEGASQNLLGFGAYVFSYIYNEDISAQQKVVLSDNIKSDELTLESPQWDIVENIVQNNKKIIVLRDILFSFDSYKVSEEYINMLDSIATELITFTDSKIIIEGHTDAIGNKVYNQQLSLRRAESIGRYLKGKGVNEANISILGKGEESPVARNSNQDGSDNSSGRKYNRRVSLFIESRMDNFIIEKIIRIPESLQVP